MNKSAKTWLLFMMVPFFVGVLIHFIVPLQIIITANPKLQDTYNGYKIEVEQNTVRALAYLNARVITNRLQMYENIRSTFIRLFQRGDIYQTINLTDITINSAYQLANNANQTQADMKRSMWYSPNVTALTDMDETEQSIYYSFIQVEPFIQSIFSSNDEIYKGLEDVTVVINYNDYHFYFQYPSAIMVQFQQANTSILSQYYYYSISNNQTQKFRLTIFDEGSTINLCTTLQLDNSGALQGVVCMGLDIFTVIKDITSVLGVPEFQLSTNNYYLVRPMYPFQGLNNPQIIANFTSTNLSQIDIPVKSYFDLGVNPLPPSIFAGKTDFSLNIQRHQRTKTYYTIPIMIYNYDDSYQVSIYLIVLNNFAKAELSEQSQNQRIAIIMIVPSVILLLISIIVTTLILRSILKKLDEALCLMGEYCSLIKRGDLQLQIPEYTETEDLRELFHELQKLNQLSKYADPTYFNVPKPQRIIRFLKCLKLFDELNYDKTNLYQNICECYVSIGDNQNAIKFLRLSIDKSIQDAYGKQQEIDRIYDDKVNKKYRPDKNMKKKEKAIKRKILRLCRLLFNTYTIGNSQVSNELTNNAELLRKICYPQILNFEYISCLFYIISCKIKMNDIVDIQPKMEILKELVKGYEQVNQCQQNYETPPDVMHSYWFSLAASLKMRQKKFVQAFQYFVKSLQSNRFDPILHANVIPQLQMILQIYGIPKDDLRKLKFTEQYKPRTDRQYIFLIDVGKPEMKRQEISNWKKKARKMADHIFNKQIRDNDRVSITEFCMDIKVVCNLIQKGNRQKMLRKQLMSSIKARDQTIVALPLPCMNKSIQRVKNLKKEKIFLIFLKGGMTLYGEDIEDEIKNVQNSKFLFFVQDTNIIQDKNDNFFVIDFDQELDVDRILEQKTVKEADNIIYIL